MLAIRSVLWKLTQVFRRQKSDDLRGELEFHVQMETLENIRRGMDPTEARRRALIALGGVENTRDEYRDTCTFRWIAELRQDLSFGMRSLKRNPGFSALAIVTLGVALAASAVMFSIIDGVFMLPLPYNDVDRLYCIYSTSKPGDKSDLTAGEFVSLKKRSRCFEGFAAVNHRYSVTLVDKGFPDRIDVAAVNEDFFNVIGGRAAIGRLLEAGDFNPARDSDSDSIFDGSVVVFSYQFWQSRYGGDKNVIGQSVRMNGKPVLIVGIAAPEVQFADLADLKDAVCWVPRVFGQIEDSRYITSFGKLKTGTSFQEAQAEMDVVARGVFPSDRTTGRPMRGISLVSLQESVVGKIRFRLLVLCGAVIFVLLIACSNMASLLLVRAAGRHKEMTVRSSMGASRMRLFRQLLTESILLCMLGGTAGLLIAFLARSAVLAMAPSDLPRLGMITIDLRTFGFTVLIALFTGLLCGIVPALRASKLDLTRGLKQGVQGNVLTGRSLFGRSLIAGQIAMALVLLIASGLMLRTYMELQSIPLNFDAHNVVIVDSNPPYYKPEYVGKGMAGRVKYCEALLTAMSRVPGVECAAIGELPIPPKRSPFAFYGTSKIQLYPEGQPKKNLMFGAVATSPDYFKVIKAHLLSGRLPVSGDHADRELSAVVNEAFALKIWPGTVPIGKKLVLTRDSETVTIEVIGLIADTRAAGLEKGTIPAVYMPLAHNPGIFSGKVLVRCASDPVVVLPGLRRALMAVDRDAALGKIEMLEQVLDRHYAVRRFNLFIISIFGALAFFLALIGVFGTIAHSVSRRTHEIGIRMALGARRGRVLVLIVRQGFWMLLIGETVGLASARLLNKLLSSLAFGIATTDAATYAVVALCWAIVVLSACFLPAFRATRIDPLVALRCE